MKLFFDTETTGKYHFDLPANDPNQPHLVQLAAVLTDDHANELASFCSLVYPDGWTIPAEVTAIHGITTEKALASGILASCVLSTFGALCSRATEVVAHNADFDVAILRTALIRHHIAPANVFAGKAVRCTMQESTDHCRIPAPLGRGHKWPTLQEAHRHFFGEGFDKAHDAMADTRACLRVHFALRGNRPPSQIILPGRAGAARIADERLRHIRVEGHTEAHDDLHRDGSLARAAACYASTAALQSEKGLTGPLPPCFVHKDWPWERQDFKPSADPIRNLEKAGALAAAEIDRLSRLPNPPRRLPEPFRRMTRR